MSNKIYIDNEPVVTESKNITLKQFYNYIKTEIYPTLSKDEIELVKIQMKNKSERIFLFGRDKDMRSFPKHSFVLKE